jgi:membrane associated rhomboid family serine protease
MFNSQKSAIAAALPGDVSKALGASGLLAGLGGAATVAAQTATSTVSSAASSTASSAARSAQAASRSSAFPMWAIILIVVVVLVAIYWFVTQSQKPAEPAKTGMFDPSAPIEYALQAAPSPVGPKRG